MTTVAGISPFVGMPLIGVETFPTNVKGTETGGVYELCAAAPITAACASSGSEGPTYDIRQSDFGSFVIPPIGAFQAGPAASNLTSTTTIARSGPAAVSKAAPILPTDGGSEALAFASATIPIWGAAMFPIIHPRVSKGSMIFLEPDLESSPAAINCFKSSIAGWQNLFAAPGGAKHGIIKAGSTAALGISTNPFKSDGTGNPFRKDAESFALATGYPAPLISSNMRNFGQVAIAQVNNGSFWLMCAAGPEWPCFGMKIRFLVMNPPVDTLDNGIHNARYAVTQAGVIADGTNGYEQASQIHAALSRS